MVSLVLAQDPPQMALIPDQGAVERLAPASADPAFGFRVHARRLHVAEHYPDPGISEDRVERGGGFRATAADHELDSMCLLAEIHHQVASLLGRPFSGGMQGNSEDADAPGGVLDHRQDIGLNAVEQVSGKEVARQDRLSLGTQESGVLAGRPQHQGLDVPASGWPAGFALHGAGGPAAADEVAVPAHDRVRSDQKPQSAAPRLGDHVEQGHEKGPVRPAQVRAAGLPPLQDGELVAQEQDLCGLPGLRTPGQPQPGDRPRDHEEDEPQAHDR